ncbi:MAG: hypothetical protein AAFW70_24780, partial [Cyanobacteria bacterium J06635_10]
MRDRFAHGCPLTKNWVSRYKAGEFEAVWRELKNLGEIKDESRKNEALAVAREIMKLVKYNLNIIANNLIQLGFEFVESEKVLVPAKSNASQYLDEFEQQWGILPFSVRAWYEEIHSVNLSPLKKLSKNSLQFLDSESVILEFWDNCEYENMFHAVSDVDEVGWYPREIHVFSLEDILARGIEADEEFRKEWEEGKVDEWTINYFIERGLDPTKTPLPIEFLLLAHIPTDK